MMLFARGICLLISCLVISSCGRKQRNIFEFKKNTAFKVSTLDFPAVRGVSALKIPEGSLVSWHSIVWQDTPNIQFSGYNVYRLTTDGFIPKKPLNHNPIQENSFLDESLQARSVKSAYLVHALFTVPTGIVKGPGSRIVW